MKPILRLLGILLTGAASSQPLLAQAQTRTLEFAAGAGNPTGNGPTAAAQTITFQTNSDNPTGNSFGTYTPTVQATFSLSNQQYSLPTSKIASGTGVSFGGFDNDNGQLANAAPVFQSLNTVGDPVNANFSAAPNTIGSGIDVSLNKGVELFVSVEPLPLTVPANQRYQYADLTITFNQAVVNPVLNIASLGGNFQTPNYTNGFTTEFDLLTSGVTLSRLSGNNQLTVNANQILNNASAPGPYSTNGAASGSVLVTTPATGITSLVLRVYLRPLTAGGTIHDGSIHVADASHISISTLTPAPAITGYVFEDVNYGGGAGRPRTASGAVNRPNARVELYNSAGAFVAATTTDANGFYSFAVGTGTYTVRVVNSTVTSSRSGSASGLLPVQTYNNSTTRVGGEAPEKADAGNGAAGTTLTSLNTTTTIAQSQATVSVAAGTDGTPVAGLDFGFNFDLIVNTNDAGQGSLRQFIVNSNTLTSSAALAQVGSNAAGPLPSGSESSIFMIPSGAAVPGQLAGLKSGLNASGVAAIAPATALPTVAGYKTIIDGTTQTYNIGNTNNVTLGAGGTVGTGATPLAKLNGPEVQLKGTRSFEGLSLAAHNITVRGLAIYGFTNNIFVGLDYTYALIEQNVLGTSATSFTDPGANVRSTAQGVKLYNSDNGTVQNNLIGFNGGMGVWAYGDQNGANNNSISGNEIRGNALEVSVNGQGLVYDGVELQGTSTGNTVSGNLITASLGNGIDTYGNTTSGNVTGGNTITDNTISNNGQGVVAGTGNEGSGLRVYSATNSTTIANNVISNNNGSGMLIENGAAKVLVSQNSIFGNTRVGIDLLTNAEAAASLVNTYNGNTGTTTNVTRNSASTGGGNGLLNYPVITSAFISGSTLVVKGYAKSGALIELFVAQPTASAAASPNNLFGQGATYLATATEGTSADADARTGLSYSGLINGVDQGSDTNANGFTFTITLTSAQQALVQAGTLLTSTATLGGATSEFSGNATAIAPLTGYVYEDVNYGGGLGRSRATLGTDAIGRPGAKVELYNAGGALVATDITDANGQYAFNADPGTGYTVRVVNNSVLSSRTGATAASGSATVGYVSDQLAVPTYSGTASRVGGENPALADATPNSGSQTLTALSSSSSVPQSIALANVGTSTNNGPDFGFNFDAVVNTNDTGRGSLRQFILNANALGDEASLAQAGYYTNALNLATGSTAASQVGVALPAGVETSIFMIPAARLTSGVAVITPVLALPQLTGPSTAVNGATQTYNIGNTNDVLLGNGGTVGTQATSLSRLNGPEVQLVGSVDLGIGLNVAGAGSQVRGLAIYGFGNNYDSNSHANITTSADNILVADNMLGTTASSFAVPPVANNSTNVRVTSGTNVSFTNNLVGFANGTGIYLAPAVTKTTITGNEIRGNGRTGSIFDGIDSHGSSTTATGNLFADGAAQGFDSYSSTGGNKVTGNTFTNNGIGNSSNLTESAAARFYGAGNTFSQNISTGNYGAGVEVAGGTTVISRNSIYANGTITSAKNAAATGQIGIDLIASGQNDNLGVSPFVTLNSATTAGANNLQNYPVLRAAKLNGTTLQLTGYAKPGAVIEFFLAQPNSASVNATAAKFGQGKTYLFTLTEGTSDTDASTGQSYSGPINGVDQGSDTNANGFTFTITLTSAQQALVQAGAQLTSTATLNGATSEFSGNVRVDNSTAPLPVVLTAFTAQAVANRDALLNWATASELNNDHFEVERSFDGATFTKIGTVAGRGTTTVASAYTLTDAGVAAQATGPVYYRLRQVDLGGVGTYSPVRSVRFTQVATVGLALYPSPAIDHTTLDLSALDAAATVQAQLLDATGRAVRNWTLGGGQSRELALRDLASGTYLLVVAGTQPDGSPLRQTLRLTKN